MDTQCQYTFHLGPKAQKTDVVIRDKTHAHDSDSSFSPMSSEGASPGLSLQFTTIASCPSYESRFQINVYFVNFVNVYVLHIKPEHH